MVHQKNRKAKRWEAINCKSPEERLLCAIVERAILDLHSPDSRERKKAIQWLMSRSDSEWSFVWVGSKLNLSSKILKKIKESLNRE